MIDDGARDGVGLPCGLPWGATNAPPASTVLRVEPGENIQEKLAAFLDGLHQRNELASKIDVLLGPGRYFGDLRINRDNVRLIGAHDGNSREDVSEPSTTILGRIVVEDCVGARITKLRVLRDVTSYAFPVGVTVRNPRSPGDGTGLTTTSTTCQINNCLMMNCHVKAQNNTRLSIYDTVIYGSKDFGILSEFGADVLLFGKTVVEHCGIGLLSHKVERDRTGRRAKRSTIRVQSNCAIIRNCAEADEMTSDGGLIIRFICVLEEMLDSVETADQIVALFKRMESAYAVLPKGPPAGWNLADFRHRATNMALRIGPRIWTSPLTKHFGRVILHVQMLLRRAALEDSLYFDLDGAHDS